MSDIERPLLSVVVPIYMAEKRLHTLLRSLSNALEGLSYELILVDDASCDNSWNKLSEAVLQQDNYFGTNILQGVGLSQNIGQYRATFLGLCYGRGRYLATLDDDLQDPPSVLRQLLKVVQRGTVEIAYGVDNKSRSLGSRILSKLLQLTNVLPVEASSFRLMSAELFKCLRKRKCSYLFIEALVAAETKKIAYVEIKRRSRTEGRSSYSFLRKCSIAVRILQSYTSFFLWIGIVGSAIFLLYGGLISVVVGLLWLFATLLSSYHKRRVKKTAEEHVIGYERKCVLSRTYED